jgi:DNA-binding MarR family transcriptional regulator
MYIRGMTQNPPNPSASEPFADFVCFSVYSANLAFNRLYKALLDQYGLTYPQYLVLVALRQRDAQTVGELGDLLHLESNTLTPLLKRMEAAGLLDRARDATDERVVRIRLTAEGLDRAEAINCIPDQVVAGTGMSSQALVSLSRQLDILAASLRKQNDV